MCGRWNHSINGCIVLDDQWEALEKVVDYMHDNFYSKFRRNRKLVSVWAWLKNPELRLQCKVLAELGRLFLTPLLKH